MPQDYTHPVVKTSLALLARNPDMPTKEVLLRALAEHPHSGHDFESSDALQLGQPHPAYSDELHPPAPFAELLRRAYSPKLDPREAALLTLLEWPRPENQAEAVSRRIDAIAERWQREVIEPFIADLDA